MDGVLCSVFPRCTLCPVIKNERVHIDYRKCLHRPVCGSRSESKCKYSIYLNVSHLYTKIENGPPVLICLLLSILYSMMNINNASVFALSRGDPSKHIIISSTIVFLSPSQISQLPFSSEQHHSRLWHFPWAIRMRVWVSRTPNRPGVHLWVPLNF